MSARATHPPVLSATEPTYVSVLLVGQAPGSSDEYAPLSDRIGTRIAGWAGVDSIDPYFDRVNVLDRFYGKWPDGKGHVFPGALAADGAHALIETVRGYDRVVFCGRAVAHAFARAFARDPHPLTQRIDRDLRASGAFSWLKLPWSSTTVAWIPHPSGVVRFWNDPANVARAERFFRNLARAASEPPRGTD